MKVKSPAQAKLERGFVWAAPGRKVRCHNWIVEKCRSGYSRLMTRRICTTNAPARSRLNSEPTIKTLITEPPIASAIAMKRNAECTVFASTIDTKKAKASRTIGSRDARRTALSVTAHNHVKGFRVACEWLGRATGKIRAKPPHYWCRKMSHGDGGSWLLDEDCVSTKGVPTTSAW